MNRGVTIEREAHMTRLVSFVSPAILDDEPGVHLLSISLAVPLKRLGVVFQHETAGPITLYSPTTNENAKLPVVRALAW